MPRQLLLLSPLLLKKAEEQFLPALKRRHGMSAFIMASCRDACGQILGGFGLLIGWTARNFLSGRACINMREVGGDCLGKTVCSVV